MAFTAGRVGMRARIVRPFHPYPGTPMSSNTKIQAQLFTSLAAIVFLCTIGCQSPQPAEQVAVASTAPEANRIERGQYLVNTSGCHDCHTPWKMGENGPEPDMAKMLSGHPADYKVPAAPALSFETWIIAAAPTNTAWTGPWGTAYTINLTSDAETGIGSWTEDMFIRAIRTGKHLGVADARPIMPPMPWPAYRNFTDEDLKAIFAYLQSVPPIRNKAPEFEPAATMSN